MPDALRIQTMVLAGGELDLVCPQFAPGQMVDVLITPAPDRGSQPLPPDIDNGRDERRSAVDILNEAPGHLVFGNANEVDEYIKEERASWDR